MTMQMPRAKSMAQTQTPLLTPVASARLGAGRGAADRRRLGSGARPVLHGSAQVY
ncbi:hypothetical protein AB0G60_27335 [Streptomyces angustmyceticus]|uniref:hypothetical protein n=1 Tax=Streptomyces angustmyceticus TaxID=285578 RepID=UPI0013024CDF|nr:hypothetical protein [Streptomyces angustmyceticus]UAL69758.1 hypothetical protein K7396_27065 [Streptomyces angustmyceticus]